MCGSATDTRPSPSLLRRHWRCVDRGVWWAQDDTLHRRNGRRRPQVQLRLLHARLRAHPVSQGTHGRRKGRAGEEKAGEKGRGGAVSEPICESTRGLQLRSADERLHGASSTQACLKDKLEAEANGAAERQRARGVGKGGGTTSNTPVTGRRSSAAHASRSLATKLSPLARPPPLPPFPKPPSPLSRALHHHFPCSGVLISGRYPHVNGVPKNGNYALTASNCLIGSVFQDAGYRTAMIGKWHVSSDRNGYWCTSGAPCKARA